MSVVANVAINVDARDASNKLRQFQSQSQAAERAVKSLAQGTGSVSAALTKTGRELQTAANGMRFYLDATGRARKENGQFVSTTEAAAAGLRRQGQAAQQATGSMAGLGAAVRNLVGSFAAIQTARFVFAKTSELETQTRSLQVLTGSAEKAGQIIQELQQLGAVTPFTSSELIESAKRLQAFGVEADNVVETTRRLADVSGATGAELQGLVTAYGQVQAKGRLQGEELLQFQERGVALQEELRRMYGLSGEEFQKALEKGRISAEAVEVAVQRLTSTGGKYANGAIAQSDTLQGRLSTLQDGIDALARRIGQVLTPALKAIFNQAIAVVDAINAALAAGRGGGFTRSVAGARQLLNIGASSQAVDNIAGGIAQVNPQRNKAGINQNLQALQQYQRLLQSIGSNDPNAGRAVQLQGIILQKINQNIAAQRQIQASGKQASSLFLPPPLLGASGGGGGGGGRSGRSAADEAKRLADELQRSIEQGEQLGRRLSRSLQLLAASSEVERKRLNIQFEYQDMQREIGELKNAEQRVNLADMNNEERKYKLLQLQTEEIRKQIEELYSRAGLRTEMFGGGAGEFRTDIDLDPNNRAVQAADELKQRLQELADPINMAQQGAQAIGSSFGSAFQGLVTGAQSAQQALASFFKGVADAFVDMAAQIIAQMVTMYAFKSLLGLFGGGGGMGGLFSGGGPVAMPGVGVGGGSSLFGAGAPSFFANGGFVTGPTRAVVGEGGEPEYVIPASKMRSAMNRYAAGARGSAVIPAGSDGGEGMAAGGATTAAPIDVRYTVERINSVDYVTADQFRAGMQQAAAQGAQRGEQRALRSLQQSTAVRSRVGIR